MLRRGATIYLLCLGTDYHEWESPTCPLPRCSGATPITGNGDVCLRNMAIAPRQDRGGCVQQRVPIDRHVHIARQGDAALIHTRSFPRRPIQREILCCKYVASVGLIDSAMPVASRAIRTICQSRARGNSAFGEIVHIYYPHSCMSRGNPSRLSRRK